MAVIDLQRYIARLRSITMEDFEFMTTIRFPELKKSFQRLNCETNRKLDNYLVLDFFEKMLKGSIACDEPEEIPISAFTDMFLCLMEKYFRLEDLEKDPDPCHDSKESFRLLFETLDKLRKLTPEYCVKFLTLCKDALNWNTDHFFLLLTEREVKLILDSFVNQRFHGWGLKKGNVLAMWLENEEEHHFCEKLFIRYGFEYNFDYEHFEILLEMFMEEMRVDDVHFSQHLVDKILYEADGNLRIQLAFELLVALFINEKNRNALSMLWKSLPYPFITTNELYNLLKPFIFKRYDLLESLCDKYEKTVPRICPVPKVSEPRSLKHLARVQVRNNLIEVHNLNEETIRELDILGSLKDYLWLGDF